MTKIGLAGVALALSVSAQQQPWPDPAFPFGAVYFRKSSPPEQDWERDHKTAAQLGVNVFRHWFMWASIENSPGQYDWRDYDRMVELEARNHIKVVIAEIVSAGGAGVDVGQVFASATHCERRFRGLSRRQFRQRHQQRAPLSGQ